jgi:hypothetical protein
MYDYKEFTSTIFAIPTNDFIHPQMGIIFIHYFGILIFGKKKFFLFFIILSSLLWLCVFYNLYKKKEFKTVQSLHDYLKDKKEIEVFFRRPSLNEERKITFTNFHEKIEVKDVKMLRFE